MAPRLPRRSMSAARLELGEIGASRAARQVGCASPHSAWARESWPLSRSPTPSPGNNLIPISWPSVATIRVTIRMVRWTSPASSRETLACATPARRETSDCVQPKAPRAVLTSMPSLAICWRSRAAAASVARVREPAIPPCSEAGLTDWLPPPYPPMGVRRHGRDSSPLSERVCIQA
jgi:hypothetical protein